MLSCGAEGSCYGTACVQDEVEWPACSTAGCFQPGSVVVDSNAHNSPIVGEEPAARQGVHPPPLSRAVNSPPHASPHKLSSERLYYLLSPDHEVGIGIRSEPELDAERTGEGVYPGDVVVGAFVQASGDGVPFLRLAYGSGWVFVAHPTTGAALLQPITEEEAMVVIAALDTNDENLDALDFDEVDDGKSRTTFHTRRELCRRQKPAQPNHVVVIE